MGKVLELEIDESIVLPLSCDNMPPELRNRLLATMTIAMQRYGCEQKDLRWSVRREKSGGGHIVSVRKA